METKPQTTQKEIDELKNELNDIKRQNFEASERLKDLGVGSDKDVLENKTENLLNIARENFISEYRNIRGEMKKQGAIQKAKEKALNILAGAKSFLNKNQPENHNKEEKFFTDEYRKSKQEYDQARIALGNEMYETKKKELEKAGLSGDDLKQALTQYKATEILAKTIIDERQKLIDAKTEGSPIKPAAWKRLLNAYTSIKPPWKRIAISTILFLPVAAVGASAAPIIAGYGLAGLATIKFAKSVAMGTVSAHAVKGIDWVNRNKDAQFKEEQDLQKVELEKKFGSDLITLEEYESNYNTLEEQRKKRERNRALLKMGVGIAIAGGLGSLANAEINHIATSDNVINDQTIDKSTIKDWRIKTNIGPKDIYKDYVPGEVGGGTNTAGVEMGDDWRIKTNIGPKDIYKDYEPRETVRGTSAPEVEADKFDDTKFNENHSKIPNDNLKELPSKPKITIEPKLEDKYALPPQVNPGGDIVSEQTLPPQVNPGETLTTPIVTNPDATTVSTAKIPKVDASETIKLTDSNSNGMTNGSIENTGYSMGAISPLKGEYNTYGTQESQELYNDENSWTTKVPMTDRAVFEQKIKIPTHNIGSNIENTDLKNIHTESIGEIETVKILDGLKDKGDVLDTFGRENIIDIEKPDTESIQNMSHENWNNYSDNLFKNKELKFEDYAEYEKETQLQKLFGTGEEGIIHDSIENKNIQGANMTYFRDQPIWPTVEKIPAKYLFNFDEAMTADESKVSQEQLQLLMKAGILNENHEFVNKQALNKLTEVYTKSVEYDTTNSNPHINQDTFKKLVEMNSKPFDNETIEKYVKRITEKVHQTNDGTLFVIKPEAFSSDKIHILNKENVNIRGADYDDRYGTRTIKIPRGNIAPRAELYKTDGMRNIYPNYNVFNNGLELRKGKILGNALRIIMGNIVDQDNKYGSGNLNRWTHNPRGY
ncbi:hypothetical protein K8Q96_02785 [Candidatus Nomurabacteria bacterium]|nr:hypothetical protein [Candidatus Nomurabacteria bacterium]